jgi:hypothetical protein
MPVSLLSARVLYRIQWRKEQQIEGEGGGESGEGGGRGGSNQSCPLCKLVCGEEMVSAPPPHTHTQASKPRAMQLAKQ